MLSSEIEELKVRLERIEGMFRDLERRCAPTRVEVLEFSERHCKGEV